MSTQKGEGTFKSGPDMGGRTGGIDIKATWQKTSESALKTLLLCSVVKYRALESCGSSKVTQAAQGAVVSHKSLSRSRWLPRHWHYKLQWVLVKKAPALDRQTLTVAFTRSKCPRGRSDSSEVIECLPHATSLWTALSACSAFLSGIKGPGVYSPKRGKLP